MDPWPRAYCHATWPCHGISGAKMDGSRAIFIWKCGSCYWEALQVFALHHHRYIHKHRDNTTNHLRDFRISSALHLNGSCMKTALKSMDGCRYQWSSLSPFFLKYSERYCDYSNNKTKSDVIKRMFATIWYYCSLRVRGCTLLIICHDCL